MLMRRLAKCRSRCFLVHGYMHKTDGVVPQRCESEEQLEQEVAKKLRAGYVDAPRSLSRRVFHEGSGKPNEKYWIIELDGKRQFVHSGFCATAPGARSKASPRPQRRPASQTTRSFTSTTSP